jgi:hypothetical protein
MCARRMAIRDGSPRLPRGLTPSTGGDPSPPPHWRHLQYHCCARSPRRAMTHGFPQVRSSGDNPTQQAGPRALGRRRSSVRVVDCHEKTFFSDSEQTSAAHGSRSAGCGAGCLFVSVSDVADNRIAPVPAHSSIPAQKTTVPVVFAVEIADYDPRLDRTRSTVAVRTLLSHSAVERFDEPAVPRSRVCHSDFAPQNACSTCHVNSHRWRRTHTTSGARAICRIEEVSVDHTTLVVTQRRPHRRFDECLLIRERGSRRWRYNV